jgi:hypothetical protein
VWCFASILETSAAWARLAKNFLNSFNLYAVGKPFIHHGFPRIFWDLQVGWWSSRALNISRRMIFGGGGFPDSAHITSARSHDSPLALLAQGLNRPHVYARDSTYQPGQNQGSEELDKI